MRPVIVKASAPNVGHLDRSEGARDGDGAVDVEHGRVTRRRSGHERAVELHLELVDRSTRGSVDGERSADLALEHATDETAEGDLRTDRRAAHREIVEAEGDRTDVERTHDPLAQRVDVDREPEEVVLGGCVAGDGGAAEAEPRREAGREGGEVEATLDLDLEGVEVGGIVERDHHVGDVERQDATQPDRACDTVAVEQHAGGSHRARLRDAEALERDAQVVE
jgi:hypothetical protein